MHDPIYQGARRDLADGGIPEPKPGLVTEAHGGILFIDEIGELDEMLQNKLLKVLEDKGLISIPLIMTRRMKIFRRISESCLTKAPRPISF